MSAHCHLCMWQVIHPTASAFGSTEHAVKGELECTDRDKLLTIS